MGHGKKLVSNTIYLFLDLFSMTILGFLFWIVVGKFLGPQEYGTISTFFNLIIFLGTIIPLGLGVALMKFISEYEKTRKKEQIKAMINYSIRIVIIVLLIVSILFGIGNAELSGLLKFDPLVTWLLIPGLIVYTMFTFTSSICYGYQMMRRYFASNFVGALIKVLVPLGLILLGFSYFGPLIGIILASLTSSLLRIDKLFVGETKTKPDKKLLYQYAFPALISSIFLIIIMNFPFILLTAIENPEVTGIFSPPMIIAILVFAICSGVFSQALFPLTSELSAKGRKLKQGYLIGIVLRYMSATILPIIFASLLFSNYLILLISSVEFIDGTMFFPFLIPGALIFGIANHFLTSLYAIKRPKTNRNIITFSIIIFLILSVFMTYQYSAYGLAVSYLVSALITAAVAFIYLRKHLKINFFAGDQVKIVVANVIAFGSLHLLRSYIPDFETSVIAVVMSSAFYLLLLYLFKFFRKDDINIVRLLYEKGKFLPALGRFIVSILEKRHSK